VDLAEYQFSALRGEHRRLRRENGTGLHRR